MFRSSRSDTMTAMNAAVEAAVSPIDAYDNVTQAREILQ